MDVINLVSSDEEDNDGSAKKKIKIKNFTIKRVKPQQNVNNTPMQVISQSKPRNNNIKPVTVIRQSKQQILDPKTFVKSVKVIEKQNTLKLSSGITITAVGHGKLNVAAPKCVTIKPTGAVTIASRPIPSTTAPSTTAPSTAVPPTRAPSSNIVKPVAIPKAAKRIVPTKIADSVVIRASSIEKSSDSDVLSRDSSSAVNDETITSVPNGTNPAQTDSPPAKRPKVSTENTPMHEDYTQLIEACKKADPSGDMEKIVAKLEKYYKRAHKEYVNSKSFHKLVNKVTEDIKAHPKLVYMKLKNLLEELKTRQTVPTAVEEPTEKSEVDEKKTKKIQLLSDALRSLQRKIRKSEEAEVDLADELNSKFLITERYKKRACQIYEKLCDLTGESQSAERIVKKPIKFTGTSYPEFNRKLEKFINVTKSFPDMFDVLRIVDACNKSYDYRLTKENRRTLAQDAFHQVGTLLQKRRKADLYEMVQYYTINNSDPASDDQTLKRKLEDNQKHYNKKMRDVIEKYAMHHGDSETNDENDRSPEKQTKTNVITPASKTSSTTTTLPTTSADLRPQSTLLPTIKMDPELEILNDSITFIADGGDYNDISKPDTILMDVQEIEEFLPTITSVTSLDPNEFNRLMKFESSQLENNIL